MYFKSVEFILTHYVIYLPTYTSEIYLLTGNNVIYCITYSRD